MRSYETEVSFPGFSLSAVYLIETKLEEFLAAVSREARSRGVDPTKPSDALDASRDVILADAAQTLGLSYSFVGDALCLAPAGIAFDFEEYLAGKV
jgi:hypothetical protein